MTNPRNESIRPAALRWELTQWNIEADAEKENLGAGTGELLWLLIFIIGQFSLNLISMWCPEPSLLLFLNPLSFSSSLYQNNRDLLAKMRHTGFTTLSFQREEVE